MNFSFSPRSTWLHEHGYRIDDAVGKAAYQTEYQRAYARWYRTQKKRVNVYCTPAQKTLLETAAQNHDRPLGTFIREAAMAYLQEGFVVPDQQELHSLRLELRRIGTNINQVVTQVNTNGYASPEDVEVLSNQLRHIETAVVEALTQPERITETVVQELHGDPNLANSLRQALAAYERECL